MHRVRTIAMLVGQVAIGLLTADFVWAQCPMCKTGLLSSPEGRQMAEGFNNGILFLLSIPFLIIGTIAVLILKAHRRSTSMTGKRLTEFSTSSSGSRQSDSEFTQDARTAL